MRIKMIYKKSERSLRPRAFEARKGSMEKCSPTGYEFRIGNEIWTEFIDSMGQLHYER